MRRATRAHSARGFRCAVQARRRSFGRRPASPCRGRADLPAQPERRWRRRLDRRSSGREMRRVWTGPAAALHPPWNNRDTTFSPVPWSKVHAHAVWLHPQPRARAGQVSLPAPFPVRDRNFAGIDNGVRSLIGLKVSFQMAELVHRSWWCPTQHDHAAICPLSFRVDWQHYLRCGSDISPRKCPWRRIGSCTNMA